MTVVIDEAHTCESESQTYKLGHIIRPATKNIVLLSATPIQLKRKTIPSFKYIDSENFEENAFDNVLNAKSIMALVGAPRSSAYHWKN